MRKSKKSDKKAAAQSASAAANKSADKTAPPPESAKDAEKSAATDAAAKESARQNAESASAAESESPPGDSVESAESAKPAAEESAEELRDLYLRAVAEKENVARRAESEIKKAYDFALAKFAPGVCEVRDCLESALAESEKDEAGEKTRTGISLTLRKLSAVMEANGILPVRPDIGANFDAGLHQAAGAGEGENARTVGKVMQCGYTLNGRLVRPAIVWLGKPPASETAADNGADDS